ncbi:hypothetical protein GCM10022243_50410 [Saccharothrix violaceirubra]
MIPFLVAALAVVGGCSYKVNGAPVSTAPLEVEPPFGGEDPSSTEETDPSSTDSPDPSGSAEPSAVGDVCSLIGWKDLPYDVPDKNAKPTDTGYDSSFDQSCKWQTHVDDLDVGVTLRFRESRTITLKDATGEVEVGGRKVAYSDRTTDTEVQPSCVLAMDYAGGGIGIIVIDGSARFGAICDQGKRVAELLLGKEPA